MEAIWQEGFFSGGPFIPHGHCYLWKPSLLWLHALSDALIAIAYFVIAIALAYFIQQRRDVPFRRIFWLFVAFIAACGLTHLLGVITLWIPQYWVSGTIKAITAVVSVLTAIELVPLIPQALNLPSPAKLATLNQALEKEVAERKAAEAEIQALNQALEARVAKRTAALELAQQTNEQLLQKEQTIRQELQVALDNLQETAERLNIALSAAKMGSWEWDVEGQEHYWSPRTQEIFGRVPPNLLEPILTADQPRVEAAIAYAREHHTPFVEEFRIRRPDNSIHWVLAQGRCLSTQNGQSTRMIGVLQETTVEKQASIELKASEARFRAVFEQAAVGMARLSPEGQWLQVNQRLCDLLGYEAENLIGQHFQAITDTSDQAKDDHLYQQFIDGAIDACRFEKRYLHRDGTPIWTMVTVSVEKDNQDQVASFIAVIEDIRDLKATRQELQHRADELEQVNGLLAITNAMLENRNAELDQFAYVASHDLKAPLRAISNLSEWIEEDLNDKIPEENKHQLSLLRNRVKRMEALINGLLEFSRAGRQNQVVETVRVVSLLDDVLDFIAPPDAFTIDIPEQLPTLVTHRMALHQVFANLIGNAIKHHDRENGTIQITSEQTGDRIEFAVTDDGPGIEPQYHQKIFTIFQTLKARDEFESTGIGLALVKKIVESEGGKIQVESTPGKGTTFRFTWPRI